MGFLNLPKSKNMKSITNAKNQLLTALVELRDQCEKHGQQGVISTIIAETINETVDKKVASLVSIHIIHKLIEP